MTVPDAPVPAILFDGISAARNEVMIAPSIDGLSLKIWRTDGSSPFLNWSFDRLRALQDQSSDERLVLMLMADTTDETPRDPARLVITDRPAIAWMRRTRPGLFRNDLRSGTFRRIALWLSAAAASVLLMLFVILPGLADRLAGWISPETEAEVGRAMLTQVSNFLGATDMRDIECRGTAGEQALLHLQDRLTKDQNIGYDIQLRVMNHEMVNAFALPGGQVIILRGHLDEANSPDEVAGVLAHEIGHVAHRDPTRLMLRAAGSAGLLSMILGDVTGGTLIAIAGDQLMQASYTRDAEANADTFAFGLMTRARISSDGLADFFTRIAAMTDGVPEFLSSHPLSADRAARAHANAEAERTSGLDLSPALSASDWAALKGICG